jgi:hypothetical protein
MAEQGRKARPLRAEVDVVIQTPQEAQSQFIIEREDGKFADMLFCHKGSPRSWTWVDDPKAARWFTRETLPSLFSESSVAQYVKEFGDDRAVTAMIRLVQVHPGWKLP